MKKRLFIKKSILAVCVSLVFSSCAPSNILENTLTTMTSDNLQGRLVGSEGNKNAVSYVESRFKELKLDYFASNSYRVPFQANTYSISSQDIQMDIRLDDDTIYKCVYGEDFLEQNDIAYIDMSTSITFNPEDPDLSNKILVLEDRDNIRKVINIAKAVLIKSELFKNSTILQAEGTPIYQISGEIFDMLKANQIKNITLKSDIKKQSSEVANVVGVLPGKDRTKAIIISAHVDHVGVAGKTIFRGAVDNASGVAVLLKIAGILKNEANEGLFNQDIVFCIFNAEESGLEGSKSLVPLLKNKYKSLYNINIDTIGIKNEKGILLEGDDESNKELKNDMARFLTNKGYNVDTKSLGLTSDNISFENASICAINIGQANTEFIHSEKDDLEILDVEFLQKISNDLAQFIVSKNDVMYKSKSQVETNNSSQIPLTAKELDELKKIVMEHQKSLKYDEFKIIDFNGVYIITNGGSSYLNVNELKAYYPTLKFSEQINNYKLDGVKFIMMKIDQDGKDINPASGKYELNKIYKRNISKEYIIIANLTYKSADETFSILVQRERSDIKTDLIFDVSDLNKLKEDSQYYIRNQDNILGIVRPFTIDSNKYVIEIRSATLPNNLADQEAAKILYDYQKDFDLNELIHEIFIK